MDRISFRLAALVAAALFTIASSDARAQTDDVAPAAPQAGPAAGTSLEDASSAATPQGPGGATTSPQDSSTVPETQEPPTTPGTQPTTLATGAAPATPPSGQQNASDPLTPPGAAGEQATQRLPNETAPAASAPAAQQAAAAAVAAPPSGPPPPAAPTPAVSLPVRAATSTPDAVPASPATARGRLADGLAQALSEVGRRLHHVQGQIDDLRHRIARGAPPVDNRLTDLRTSLGRIAPMLAGLQAGIDAAGRLSPDLRQLLHRVNSDLHRVQAAAGGLIRALRHAKVGGAQTRALIHQLERFRGFRLGGPPRPAFPPAPAPPSVGTGVGLPPAQPTPAASPSPPPAAMSQGRGPASSPRNGESHQRRGSNAPASSPWSSALDAASAAPGGGFFFAAVASLTMLLIGLVLPGIRARLDLPPGGRYTVAFLTPLERPG